MNIINQRMEEIDDLLSQVKSHCMCFTFLEDDHYYTVHFPQGDFYVDGVRASKLLGKAKALNLLLVKLEYYWESSYPGYIHKKDL